MPLAAKQAATPAEGQQGRADLKRLGAQAWAGQAYENHCRTVAQPGVKEDGERGTRESVRAPRRRAKKWDAGMASAHVAGTCEWDVVAKRVGGPRAEAGERTPPAIRGLRRGDGLPVQYPGR